MKDDWSVIGARKLAAACSRNGLRCRIVRCASTESRLRVYRDGEAFGERIASAQAEAIKQNIDANWVIVNRQEGAS